MEIEVFRYIAAAVGFAGAATMVVMRPQETVALVAVALLVASCIVGVKAP